jgi:membrane protein
VIVLLFYFFISAAILLFGAELNSQIYHRATEGGEYESERAPREGAQ